MAKRSNASGSIGTSLSCSSLSSLPSGFSRRGRWSTGPAYTCGRPSRCPLSSVPRGRGFHAAMAIGRLGAAWTVALVGNRRTLLGVGLLTAVGMALALATREPLLVVAGFLVVGLALSATVPVAFSVAGDLAPGRAGGAISVVTTLGYGGFLFGPVLVGGLAEILGLRVALGTIAVAGALIFALSLRLAPANNPQPLGKTRVKNGAKASQVFCSEPSVTGCRFLLTAMGRPLTARFAEGS